MNIIIIFLGSILASFSIETIFELNFFKDVADLGYKVDMNKVSDTFIKIPLYKMFIPGLNLYEVIRGLKSFNKKRIELLSNIENSDVFVKMDNIEHQMYLDNPKSVSAFNMAIDLIFANEHSSDMVFINNGIYRHEFDNGKFNQIQFRRDNNVIFISNIDGELLKLSESSRKNEISKIFSDIYNFKVTIRYENHDFICEDENLELNFQDDGPVLKRKI
jgi:hypothetical protein